MGEVFQKLPKHSSFLGGGSQNVPVAPSVGLVDFSVAERVKGWLIFP